jgi:tRNA threonylcarbamoyladenosine biosynthesis protein TsaE
MERVFTLEQINLIAAEFWKAVYPKKVIVFHGSMGAGKTTFIHALCEVRKVKDVTGSPTFSIINEYLFEEASSIGKIYHIDLYRLKDEEEAIQAGVEDCLYNDHICLVEWPEKAPGLFSPDTIHVYIEAIDSDTRKLIIEGI